MQTTSNLSLPFIMPAQAQKHVTHNDALLMLDALVQLSVASRQLSAPPEDPEAGERHIVAGGASAGWTGVPEGHVAAFQDGAWRIFAPQTGWMAWIADEGEALVFDGEAWSPFGGTEINPAAMVGVNASADETNRLAVKSDAVLLSHDDVTPGNGGIQLKLNKAAPGDTASVIYQTGWSGRAEFGTSGDDDFHIKVSANGDDWHEALVIEAASGAVSLPHTAPVANSFNLVKDAGRFAGSPEPQKALRSPLSRRRPISFPPTGRASRAARNTSTITAPMAGRTLHWTPDIDALVSKWRDGRFPALWRGVFFAMEITGGQRHEHRAHDRRRFALSALCYAAITAATRADAQFPCIGEVWQRGMWHSRQL